MKKKLDSTPNPRYAAKIAIKDNTVEKASAKKAPVKEIGMAAFSNTGCPFGSSDFSSFNNFVPKPKANAMIEKKAPIQNNILISNSLKIVSAINGPITIAKLLDMTKYPIPFPFLDFGTKSAIMAPFIVVAIPKPIP